MKRIIITAIIILMFTSVSAQSWDYTGGGGSGAFVKAWLKIQGTFYTDYLEEYTTDAGITLNSKLNIGYFDLTEDGGTMTIWDMNITAAGTSAGDDMSSGCKFDGNTILRVGVEADGSGGIQNEYVDVNGRLVQETYCISKVVSQTSLVDATATNVFTITTTTGNFGMYKCYMTIIAGDDIITGNANMAAMGLDAHFARIQTSANAGVNTAVGEISQTASANEGTGAIANITMTVVETSELVQTIQANVDVSASGVADVLIMIEVKYWGFAIPPVIAGS